MKTHAAKTTANQHRPPATIWQQNKHDALLVLQRLAGNQAIHALISSGLDTSPSSSGYAARGLADAGQPLPTHLRHRFERSFHTPLDHVRVHDGLDAAQLAAAIDARAFTLGCHVGFPARGLSPDSPTGYRLLAHELSHVVQQTQPGSGAVRSTHRGDTVERSATAAADRVSGGGVAAPLVTVSGALLGREGTFDPLEWLGNQAKAGKEAGYQWLIAQLRGLHQSGITRLRSFGEHLTGVQRAVFDTMVMSVDLTMTILEGLVYAVVGIVGGFATGIGQMIVGLIRLVLGVAEGILKFLYGFIDGGREFDVWVGRVGRTIAAIPAGLRMLVDDWLVEFKKASPEQAALMVGELTGQILAFIATLGVSAGKAGSVAQSAKLAPKLARLAESAMAPQLATTTGVVLPTAAEASPKAIALSEAAVRHGVAATAAATPPALQMAAHSGGAGGGGSGTGGSQQPTPQSTSATKQAQPPKVTKLPPGPPGPPQTIYVPEPAVPEGLSVRPKGYRPAARSASEVLGHALGPPPGPGYNAHHIIPTAEGGTTLNAIRTEALNAGLASLNEAENGVWLVDMQSAENVGGGIPHTTYLHAGNRTDYIFTIRSRLSGRRGPHFLRELGKIKQELADGSFQFRSEP